MAAHLARRCLARGDVVHLVVRRKGALGHLSNVIDNITVHTLEFSDTAALARCFEIAVPDEVFHLAVATRAGAGSDFQDAFDSLADLKNLLALVSAAAAASHPPQVFVRAGSIAEYGPGPYASHEDQREAPATAYSVSLVAGTQYLQSLRSKLPFRVATARLALLYGPGQSEAFFIPYCVRRLCNRETVIVTRPRDRRDLLYIDDAIDGLIAVAAAEQCPSGVFNLATGLAPEIGEVARMLAAAAGAPAALVQIAPDFAAPPSVLRASPERARQMLNWQAKTSLQEGFTRTVAAASPTNPLNDHGSRLSA